jgi:hypothetical protein
MRTLKSNLAVEGCWRAFPPALDSVAELMGKKLDFHMTFFVLLEQHICFYAFCSLNLYVCLYLIYNIITCESRHFKFVSSCHKFILLG